jgi:branched-subunit amino acid ABC-type transport system permease component
MFLSYKFIFSVLLNRRASNFVLLIASFGLLTATAAIIGMIFGSQSTLIARHLSDVYTVNIFGAVLNIAQVVSIITIPIIICILAYILWRTRFGRAVRAVEDDNEVAELVGIPKEKIISQIFFISGLFAGLGGIVEGLDLGIIPASGLLYILPIMVIAIVGGIRSFWGGILAAFVMAIAQKLTVVFLGGSWEQAVPFAILIIVLLVRPEGILKR